MMSDTSQPLPAYQKDRQIEDILADTNARLETVEQEIRKQYSEPALPSIFLIGLPRSGHTLAGQILTTRYQLAYPSNFIARLWKAPLLGTRLQRVGLDQSFGGKPAQQDFESEHGLTFGPYGLHEFGYFWSGFFDFEENHDINKQKLSTLDTEWLKSVVAGMEKESGGLPVLFKNGTIGFQAGFIADIFPRSLFVFCVRDPLYVCQSILNMRIKRFGRKEIWFGFKPAEYEHLKELPWYEQIAGQAAATYKAMKRELNQIPDNRKMIIDYERLCKDAHDFSKKVEEMFNSQGADLKIKREVPPEFECRNRKSVNENDFQLIKDALHKFSSDYGLRDFIQN